jgi:predicted outer membrane protein
MKRHAALLIASLALSPLAVTAQTVIPPAAEPPPTFSRTATDTDSRFVFSLLAQARTQLALAELAQRNAHRARTHDLAAREISQWTPVRDRLLDIAAVQGMPTPNEVDGDGQRALDRLNALPPSSFDDAYAEIVSASDQRAMRAMEAERRSSNPALVAFVNERLGGFGSADSQHR